MPKMRNTEPLDQLSKPAISTSIERAGRLAVTKQRLAGRLPSRPTRDHILSAVRDLCYVQWDLNNRRPVGL